MGKMKEAGFDPRALAYVSAATPPQGLPAEGGEASPSRSAQPPSGAPDSAAAQGQAAGRSADSARAAGNVKDTLAARVSPGAAIRAVERSYNRHIYEIRNDRPGILVFSELYFPHWHLRVDGKESPLLRTDFALRGAALQPGEHRVEMTYASPWIRKGFAAAGASLLALILGTLGMRFVPRTRGTHGA
jgi:hypothetical protein